MHSQQSFHPSKIFLIFRPTQNYEAGQHQEEKNKQRRRKKKEERRNKKVNLDCVERKIEKHKKTKKNSNIQQQQTNTPPCGRQ